ncbi:MAG: peptidase M4 [Thaumarchaeota archaeon]|nr:peptidase M4 [Nitrososphaerota archaeon]
MVAANQQPSGFYGNGMMSNQPPSSSMMGNVMNGMMGGSMMNQMMGGMNMNNMMGMMNGCMGMMGSVMGGPYDANVKPITIEQALANAHRYVSSLNNTDLVIEEVEEYSNNFNVAVQENSTRNFALQLLIDRFSGGVYPEPGPNMMWNTKYGSMGMMSNAANNQMPISKSQAMQIVQKFLDSYLPGAKVGDVDTFYGYYNIEVLLERKTHGMLSVNGFNGQIWYHIWHGTFIQEKRP